MEVGQGLVIKAGKRIQFKEHTLIHSVLPFQYVFYGFSPPSVQVIARE